MSLASTQLIGFGGQSQDNVASFTAPVIPTPQTANATTYTFSGVSVPNPAANRQILVMALARVSGGANATLTSITVQGAEASNLVDNGNIPNHAEIALITDTSNTAVDIVVTYSGTMLSCTIAVYEVFNMSSSLTSSGTDTTDPYALTADVPAGGLAFGCALDSVNTTSTPTGLTEDYDATTESSARTFGSFAYSTAQSGITLQFDMASSSAGRGTFVTFDHS